MDDGKDLDRIAVAIVEGCVIGLNQEINSIFRQLSLSFCFSIFVFMFFLESDFDILIILTLSLGSGYIMMLILSIVSLFTN